MKQRILVSLLLVVHLIQAMPPATKPRREFRYQSANSGRATYNYDGRLVLAASAKRSQIGVYHGRTALLVNEFRGHRQVVGGLASWPDRDTVVSGDANGLVLLWRPRTGQIVARAQVMGRVVAVRPQPGGPLVAVLTSTTAELIDITSGRKQLLRAGQLPISLAFNATGTQLALGYMDGSMIIHDLKSNQQTSARPFSTPIRALTFRGDSLLATGGTAALFVWPYTTSAKGHVLPVTKPVWAVSQQPGQGLLLGTVTGDVMRYELATQTETIIGTAKSPVRELLMNPREQVVLANYRQEAPKSWLLQTAPAL